VKNYGITVVISVIVVRYYTQLLFVAVIVSCKPEDSKTKFKTAGFCFIQPGIHLLF